MDDLIRRQAAIDAVVAWTVEDRPDIKMPTDLVGRIDALPSSQQWIPIKTRPMDEEEKQYWEEHYGYTFGEDYDGTMFDCPMPEDGQKVWVCSKCGNVWQDTCEVDIGIGLEGNGDWEDIVAWMPFERPKPYKEKKDDEMSEL